MLFFQYMVLLMFFSDDLGIDNSAASSMAFVMMASFVSIYVHSMLGVALVTSSR